MNAMIAATPALTEVLNHPGIWRRSSAVGNMRVQSTGIAGLDALLPGGGWPQGALSEILVEHDGLGELSLLLPALVALTRKRRRIAFIAPPYIPYAPALTAHGLDLDYVTQIDTPAASGMWSVEQCLRSGACAAALGWLAQADYTLLRRLQLAAETGDALGFVFRPAGAIAHASPAALRLRIFSDAGSSWIEILKCRGNFDQRRATRLRWRA